ncbi:MAG TPA: FtsQ-type POTRA domain-containing protein [Acidimicrobiales bacterium]|nr:FtsQ-type POTRA domain-containing protein [Acidimicrobiales bacterium]
MARTMQAGARQKPAATTPKRRSPIHPKIKERRVAVTKEAGRRRLKAVAGAGALAAAAVGAWALTRSPLLDIDEVRAAGAERTMLEEIIVTGGLDHGTPMTDVDPAGSAAAISRLPWVASAKVERRWPGSVVVTVTERQPVAGVARPQGGWALVDKDARVLVVIDGPPVGLPHIHDAKKVPDPGQHLEPDLAEAATAAAALPESLKRVVGGVNLRGDGVELALTAGGVVRLGDPGRQLAEKLRAAATVLNRVGVDDIGVLDVTVPRAPVLARR